MDPTKNGVAGKITIIASAAATLGILFGGIWNLSQSVNDVNGRLDRNLERIERLCLSVKALDVDVRLHDLQTTKKPLPEPVVFPLDC